jgi:predicted permease
MTPSSAGGLPRTLIRLGLCLYPRGFRRRYGREIEQLVQTSWRAGPNAAPARFWLGVASDLLGGAVREHVAAFDDWRRARQQTHLARIHGSQLDPSPQVDGMNSLAQDIRYAWRTIRKSPGFAFVVIASLAVGVGANTLIYSVVDGLVLRPFPYPDADRLVSVGVTFPALNGERTFIEAVSPPEYADIKTYVPSIGSIVAFDLGNRNISGGDQPERVFTAFVWGDPLATIGVRPFLGRTFRPDETTTRGNPIAVLSHRIWASRFGGDSAIVGKTIRVNGEATQVIGIMPPGLLVSGTDLWLPMGVDPLEIPRQTRQWTIIGRLRDGATLESATREARALAARTERDFARERKEYAGWRMEVDTWANAVVGEFRTAAAILMGSVALVLLIACANIASLLLARAAGRQREIAVRRALGAGKGRIARQLLTESLLLALAGGAVGLVIAYALVGPTTSLFPQQFRSAGVTATINGRVLVYTLIAAVVSGLLFGVAPALQGFRFTGGREWLTGEGVGGRLTMGVGGRRLRSGFIVVEIALSLMLLVGAGVLLRSFARLNQVNPGFDTHNVLTMRLSLPREQYQDDAVGTFFEEVTRRVGANPGVKFAGAATQFAPSNGFTTSIAVEGQAPSAVEQRPRVDITDVSGDYFNAMGYTLVRGRFLATIDDRNAPPAAVVNESVVRRFFRGQNPLGRRIALGDATTPNWIEVVGVVGDVHNRGLQTEPVPEVFVPVRRQLAGWNNQLFLTIRTKGDPLAMLPNVRQVIASVDPIQPVYLIRTLDDALAEAVAQRRASMLLITIFAGVALALAAVGIYGLMSYMVNERTHEIGIRMALGAAGGDVLGLIVRQTMKLVALGAAFGLVGALMLGKALATMVFEVTPSDPATLAAVTVVLTLVAIAATSIPAIRATRVTPLVALRRE